MRNEDWKGIVEGTQALRAAEMFIGVLLRDVEEAAGLNNLTALETQLKLTRYREGVRAEILGAIAEALRNDA